MRRTDAGWEKLGRTDPFYAVLSAPEYAGTALDDIRREEFFESGEAHVTMVLDDIERHVLPGFRPRRSLDFGCGVGRLVVPLARRCAEVVGVDVSPSMLELARESCARAGVTNAAFALSDDALSAVLGRFDFLHSYIVFQHITPHRGERLAAAMLERLEPGGVFALHFTYGRDASLTRKLVHWSRKHVPGINALVNVAQGRAAGTPMMQMHRYALPRLLRLFTAASVTGLWLRPTDHGGHLGAIFYGTR